MNFNNLGKSFHISSIVKGPIQTLLSAIILHFFTSSYSPLPTNSFPVAFTVSRRFILTTDDSYATFSFYQ